MTRRNKTIAALLAALFLCAVPPLVNRATAADPAIGRVAITELPVTGAASILTSSITVHNAPARPATALRITVGLINTNSVFNVEITGASGSAVTYSLNSGTALTAGSLYTFVIGIDRQDQEDAALSYNFNATTTTTLGYLSVQEVQDGAL